MGYNSFSFFRRGRWKFLVRRHIGMCRKGRLGLCNLLSRLKVRYKFCSGEKFKEKHKIKNLDVYMNIQQIWKVQADDEKGKHLFILFPTLLFFDRVGSEGEWAIIYDLLVGALLFFLTMEKINLHFQLPKAVKWGINVGQWMSSMTMKTSLFNSLINFDKFNPRLLLLRPAISVL